MPTITDLSQLDPNKHYTYGDYLTWRLKERVELIRGKIFKMSPAPSVIHQRISSELHGQMWHYLKNKSCQVFSAPFDVRLPLPADKQKGDKIDTVVQPDITIICDESKLDAHGCIGAPDLIIEILSPGNTQREMKDKYTLYENAGVKEYWVVDPEHFFILQYTLNEQGKYTTQKPFTENDELGTPLLPGLAIQIKDVFQ